MLTKLQVIQTPAAAIALIVSVLSLALALYALRTPAQPQASVTPFEECTTSIRSKMLTEKYELNALHSIDQICYDHVYYSRVLDDFQIRRAKYVQQNLIDYILLWMVVCITVSGVMLAGLQLLGSFRLASLGKGNFGEAGEVSFEARGNMSLKSSVTGLLILVVSFGFFLVYVGWVYPIRPANVDAERRADQVQPRPKEAETSSTQPPNNTVLFTKPGTLGRPQ